VLRNPGQHHPKIERRRLRDIMLHSGNEEAGKTLLVYGFGGVLDCSVIF